MVCKYTCHISQFLHVLEKTWLARTELLTTDIDLFGIDGTIRTRRIKGQVKIVSVL